MLDMKLGRRVTLRVGPAQSRAGGISSRATSPLPVDGPTEKALTYKAGSEAAPRIGRLNSAAGASGSVHIADMSEDALARLNTGLRLEKKQKEGSCRRPRQHRTDSSPVRHRHFRRQTTTMRKSGLFGAARVIPASGLSGPRDPADNCSPMLTRGLHEGYRALKLARRLRAEAGAS